MPGPFAVGIQALRAAHSTLRPGKDLFTFLDDAYITCSVERIAPTFRALRSALAEPPGRLPCGRRFARGAPLERAAVRICREGEPRVATNVFSRDMKMDVPLAGSRCIEVLANGLPLWQGAQVAVDTTFVSPVSRDGSARAGAVFGRGKRWVQSCWRLIAAGWSCWVVVLVPSWRISSAEWLLQRRAQRSSNCHWIWRTSAMARNRPWWRTRASRLPARS